MSFYRIQDATYDPADLLDGPQTSLSYCTGTERPGKSVCTSIEELAAYFAQAGVPMDPRTSILVELDGTWATDEDGRIVEDEDAALGAHLVFPTRIISAGPIPAEFFAAVDAYFETAA